MLRNTFLTLAMLVSLLLVGGNAVAADPTLHQVYQAADAGNYREAQSMMDQVLRNHPNSAKAHFVEAELLARQGRLSDARLELATAERLEPGLPFAGPGAVQELNARLAAVHSVGQARDPVLQSTPGPGIPWGALLLVAGLIAVIVFVVRMLRQRSAYAVQGAGLPAYSTGAGSAPPYGGGGMGPMAPTGGIGSGLLGSLATGAAVGAGVVAGEALMHRVLDGHRSEDTFVPTQGDLRDISELPYDMGGNDFGVSDTSSWDDSASGGADDWT